MKKTLIFVSILILVIGVFLYFSPKSTAPNTKTPTPASRLTFLTIHSQVKNGQAYLFDVRTPEEFATGHLESAVNFDSVKIDAGEYPDVTKNAVIYLYCRSGSRVGVSKTKLESAGFTNVTNLGGLPDDETIGGKLQP